MAITIIISLIGVSLSLSAGILSFLNFRNQRKIGIRTIIGDLIKEYRSNEMYFAIKQLWDLYRQSDMDEIKLVVKYKERFDMEEAEEKKMVNNNEYYKTTIHHSRRMVILYYLNIAKMIESKLFDEKYFFSLWNYDDLNILRNIILPIQRSLLPLYNRKETDEVITLLELLCKKSELYYKKKLLITQNKR